MRFYHYAIRSRDTFGRGAKIRTRCYGGKITITGEQKDEEIAEAAQRRVQGPGGLVGHQE